MTSSDDVLTTKRLADPPSGIAPPEAPCTCWLCVTLLPWLAQARWFTRTRSAGGCELHWHCLAPGSWRPQDFTAMVKLLPRKERTP